MDQTTMQGGPIAQRGQMALLGALAGISFYALSHVYDKDVFNERTFLALIVLAVTFFTALLALAGPLTIGRSVVASAAMALITTVLFVWASLRFPTLDGYLYAPFPALAAVIIGTVPLPFALAAAGPGWRDYPALFSAAWTIVVRYAAAWVFVGVVWGVIYLSDTLLSIVGLRVIQKLIEQEAVPFLVTGITLGLALAVVQEMKEYVSPFLILRLLRLLLPVILLVMVVFILALPVQGLSGLFGGLSVAATLLAMTAAAATLITTAVDQSDADATQNLFLSRATQALALILPVPAALAAYSVWLRVDQYGWTPDRLFAVLMCVLALGYGMSYAAAVVRQNGWMEKIRQANVFMALAGIAAAILWLTPILNAERISANNLVARYRAGKTDAAALDIDQLGDWGLAGTAARETLVALAKDPGQTALAQALDNAAMSDTDPAELDPVRLRADFAALLPLQPATATADRDRLLAGVEAYELDGWLKACQSAMPDGRPGCVMVVADFSPLYQGPQAVLVLRDPLGGISYEAFVQRNGVVERRSVTSLEGYLPYDDSGAAMIAQMQSTPPKMAPVPLQQLQLANHSLVILP